METLTPAQIDCPQRRFEQSYVTSSEICQIVGVTKAAITKAVARGDIPRPIVVNCQMKLWERKTLEPYLQKWKDKSKN